MIFHGVQSGARFPSATALIEYALGAVNFLALGQPLQHLVDVDLAIGDEPGIRRRHLGVDLPQSSPQPVVVVYQQTRRHTTVAKAFQ